MRWLSHLLYDPAFTIPGGHVFPEVLSYTCPLLLAWMLLSGRPFVFSLRVVMFYVAVCGMEVVANSFYR